MTKASNFLSQQQKKNPSGIFSFLGIGLLEIGFVGILLIIFFGPLTYCNIIKLPFHFSFFQKQAIQQPSSQQTFTTIPATPTPTIHFITYDQNNAKNALEEYIQQVLKPNEYSRLDSLILQTIDNTFTLQWNQNNKNFAATLFYEKGSFAIRRLQQTITYDTTSPITQSQVGKLINDLTLQNIPQNAFTCKTTSSTSFFCEKFILQNNNKFGVGVIATNKGKNVIVFSCKFTPDSKSYSSLRSCY